MDVQPEIESRVELVRLQRLLPERKSSLLGSSIRFALVTLDTRQRKIRPDRTSAASPGEDVVNGVLGRFQHHAAIVARAVIADGDVTASHRNLEPQLPADMVPQLDDAWHPHLEGRRAEDALPIFRDHYGAVLPSQIDSPLPGDKGHRETQGVENESVGHKTSSRLGRSAGTSTRIHRLEGGRPMRLDDAPSVFEWIELVLASHRNTERLERVKDSHRRGVLGQDFR